jgi:hypothetical protein
MSPWVQRAKTGTLPASDRTGQLSASPVLVRRVGLADYRPHQRLTCNVHAICRATFAGQVAL